MTKQLLFRLTECGNGRLFLVHSVTWWKGTEEMELDFSGRCGVVGFELMDTSYFTGNSCELGQWLSIQMEHWNRLP